jgi:hypothetical protein
MTLEQLNEIRDKFLKSNVSIEELLSMLRPASEQYDEEQRELINEGG